MMLAMLMDMDQVIWLGSMEVTMVSYEDVDLDEV